MTASPTISRGRGVEPDRTTSAALERIDAALGLASRRELFLADEARDLLSGIGSALSGPGHPDAVDLIERIMGAFDAGSLVAAPRVVDGLLDLRLAVTRGRQPAGLRCP
jgi:hypothetical protein